MPLRRSHTKSRKGCLECKRRHTKCDEELPKCTLCRKRKLNCSYPPNPSDPDSSQGSPDPRDGSESSTRTVVDDLPMPTRMLEMRLLHQYLTSTYHTLAKDGLSAYHLSNTIPQMATSFPYLLDGILALSALHLATLEPDNRLSWLDAAVRYQSQSCSGMGKILPMVTPQHCEPAFLSSVFIMLFATGFSGLSRANHPMDPIIAVVEVRTLISGCAVLFSRLLERGAQAQLEDWLYLPEAQESFQTKENPNGTDVTVEETQNLFDLHKNLMHSLLRLQSIIETDQSPNQPDYESTWQILHKVIEPWPKLGLHGGILAWPLYISENFISLVQDGDWTAKVLFLHYSVAMCLMCNRWYVRDWGRRAVLAILEPIDEIPPQWEQTISWVKQAVEIAS